jgi:hypothetical protein
MPITLAVTEPSRLDWHRHRPAPLPWQDAMPDSDADFIALQDAYRQTGGIARGDQLAMRMGQAGRGGYIDLARRIVAGQLFSFRWHDCFWVPMFQFDPDSLSLREPPRRVLDELRGVIDGWDLAHWYVRANDTLAGHQPLQLLDTELPAVLAAARADRHAIDG